MPKRRLKPILTRQSDSLVSIGCDPVTLLAFKLHSGLPGEITWTEADNDLQAKLQSAETIIDNESGTPYRARTFQLQVDHLIRPMEGWVIDFPVYPIASITSVTWVDDNGNSGSYIQNTDYRLFGGQSLNPWILFPRSTYKPITHVETPYALTVNFVAGPSLDQASQRLAIFQLAAHFYRYPEAVFDKELFFNPAFQNIVDSFSNTFL